jgi:tetratricopeptide (TPR) repeat protein
MKLSRVISPLTLIASILLIFVSFKIRTAYQPFFMGILTAPMTGEAMFDHIHNPWKLFLPHARTVVATFFMAYVVSQAFLWGAAFCIYRAFLSSRIAHLLSGFSLEQFLAARQKEVLMGLFIAGFSLSIFFNFYMYLNEPPTSDEFSYLFQARIVQEGKLYEISPPLRDSFSAMFLRNNGKWFSRYPVGWPILMALGGFAGNFHLLADLAAGLFLVVLFKIGHELHNRSIGLLGAFSALFSPFFLLTSATFQPHVVDLFFISCMILYFIKFLKNYRGIDALLLSLFFGCALHIRLDSAVLIIPSFVLVYLFNPFRKGAFYKSLITYLIHGLPVLLIFLGLLLAATSIQYGNPFMTGYGKEITHLSKRMTFVPALWTALLSGFRLFMWSPCGVLEMVILACWGATRHKYFLLSLILPYYAFYSMVSLGQIEFGSRYLFPCLAGLCILTGEGLYSLRTFFENRSWENARLFTAALLLCWLIMTLFALFPLWPSKVRHEMLARKAFDEGLERYVLRYSPKALVFVRNLPDDAPVIVAMKNHASLSGPIIYANFFDTDDNRALIERFNDATPFVLRYDPQKGEMMIDHYSRERQESPTFFLDDLFYAAANYRDAEIIGKSEETYRKFMAMRPDSLAAYMGLVRLYESAGRRDKAIATLESFLSQGRDSPDVHLYLARLYAARNDLGKALAEIKKVKLESLNDSKKPEAEDLREFLVRATGHS